MLGRGSEPSGLSRDAVVQAGLLLLDEVGRDGLSMRALADRLGVKAASLYWHLRDKDQLLEFLAEAVLERVEVPVSPAGWRTQASTACQELASVVRDHPAMASVVLASLPVVQRSRLARDLTRLLGNAGLADPDAAAFALVVEVVAAARLAPSPRQAQNHDDFMTLAIDSGSWRTQIRASASGGPDIARSVGGAGAPSVEVRADRQVVVRSYRGGNRGAVELNPAYTWHVKLHGGTWNTVLDLTGLRISGIEFDSGSGNVSCILPAPQGVVPIRVNSGIVGVSLRRPRGSAVSATVSGGSARVRFDGQVIRAAASDAHWETPGGSHRADRYEVTVHSGSVKVTMEPTAPSSPPPPVSSPPTSVGAGPNARAHVIVELMLDGIEARLKRSA